MKRPLALVLVALMGLAPACARREPPREDCVCAPGEPVVDPVLLAFLSKARAAHHAADLAEDDKDLKRAMALLDELVRGPRPGDKSPPPEVAEVIADTYARLADLRSQEGDTDGALRDIDAGLELAKSPTHFRGRLFEVRGVVLERRLKELEKGGDKDGAGRVKTQAIEAFDKAIEIQNQVIESSLPGGADGGAPRR